MDGRRRPPPPRADDDGARRDGRGDGDRAGALGALERAAPPHAAAHAARLAPAGRPRRDRALGGRDGLGHGPRAGGRARRAVRRRPANASRSPGSRSRTASSAPRRTPCRSQPIVWALRSGLALLVEPRPSLGRVARDLHAALRRAGVGRGRDGGRGRRSPPTSTTLGRSYEEAALDPRARARALRRATSSSSTRSSASTGCCRACRSTSCAATAPRRSARCSSTTATTTARSSTRSRSSCAASATA